MSVVVATFDTLSGGWHGDMKGNRIGRLFDLWVDHYRLDWMIASLVLALHLMVVLVWGHGDLLGWSGKDDRHNVYITGASVAALIGGFSTAAIAFYSSMQGRRSLALREQHRISLRKSWMGTLVAPLLASGLCIVALILDHTEKDSGGVHWIFEWAFLFATLRFARLAFLFRAMLDIDDSDRTDNRRPPAPEIALSRRAG